MFNELVVLYNTPYSRINEIQTKDTIIKNFSDIPRMNIK